MKLTKLLGLLLVGLGLILIVFPAALPATVVHEGGVHFQARNDGCGAAVVAVFEHADDPCGQTARTRLLLTTAGGLILMVAGVVLVNDPNAHYRSRVDARS
jgi:hypothetical protein